MGGSFKNTKTKGIYETPVIEHLKPKSQQLA